MIVNEDDIDFKLIDWKRFEELCFDFLIKNHFHNLIWRQGGGDSGRDIEAFYTSSNPIIGSYEERWFVECKNHSRGLDILDVSSKVEWAIAEAADHLLIITSSYLTQGTRNWWILRFDLCQSFRSDGASYYGSNDATLVV